MPQRQALLEVHAADERAEEEICACAGSLLPMLAAKTAPRTEAVVASVGIAEDQVQARQLEKLQIRDLEDLRSGLQTGSLARVRLVMPDDLAGGFGRAGSAV